MARIRTIKPEFFTSDDVCALSPLGRLLFIACWCEADREGRLEWKPKTLRRKYLPEDECDGEALCQELVTKGVIVLYGQGLAYVTNFKKHQLVNAHEAKSKLPNPQECTETHVHADASQETHVGKGREGKGKDTEAKASGADAPPEDPAKRLFDEGVAWLKEITKRPDGRCRALLGKWRKTIGDDRELLALIAQAKAKNIQAPESWFETIATRRRADKTATTYEEAVAQRDNDPAWMGVQ